MVFRAVHISCVTRPRGYRFFLTHGLFSHLSALSSTNAINDDEDMDGKLVSAVSFMSVASDEDEDVNESTYSS